ncbi:SGNH/GDSL hydrolase family protein [Alicyclobacillaceae bacterium I2511]|nr:SGNH/GDSL hydrolase family protein [Alicyclobacillaceae bacterium I2511]
MTKREGTHICCVREMGIVKAGKTAVSLFTAATMMGITPGVAMAATTNDSIPVTPNSITLPIAQNGLLVALGDSISFGYNLGPNNNQPSQKAFPYLLAKWNGDTVQDLGVPGWTSSNLLTALQQNTAFQSTVRQASVITIDIGSNDLLGLAEQDGLLTASNPDVTPQEQSQFAQAIAGFAQNLPQILERVHSLAPHAYIVLYNLYDPISSQYTGLHALAEQLVGKENQVIAGVASQAGLTVADAYAAFNGNQNVLVRPADVHPTVLGQDALAAVGERALTTEQWQAWNRLVQTISNHSLSYWVHTLL